MIEDIERLPRVCSRCLAEEGDKMLDPGCEHRFVKRTCWVAVVATALYGVRSEQAAVRVFGECCWDEDSYQYARALTPDEVRRLRSGEARIVIGLAPTK